MKPKIDNRKPAAATAAALENDPGVYNVVDDDPSEMSAWLPAFARFLGAPAPKLGLAPRKLEWLSRPRAAAS